MPITLYQCEKCGLQHKSKDSALRCEKSHLAPVEITNAKYDREDKPTYPAEINIKLSDGKTITYYRKRDY